MRKVAANLGAPVALVVRGADRSPPTSPRSLAQARGTMEDHHAKVVAASSPTGATPTRSTRSARRFPRTSAWAPSRRTAACTPLRSARCVTAIDGEMIAGDEALLSREVRAITIGAMTVEHLLDRLEEGALVIAPGDRADALLAVLTAHRAAGFPSLAGHRGQRRLPPARRPFSASSTAWARPCPSSPPTRHLRDRASGAGTPAAACRASPCSRWTRR